jgi:hypothetical protein
MMIGSANTYLTAAWDRFILVADQSPRSIFAGILVVLTVLVGIALISLFSRLRSLKARNRQLGESLEALSSRLEETRVSLDAKLDAKISALSASGAREAPAPAPKDKERELPAALMREELVSLQLDLRAPEDRAEAPAIGENS